MNKLFRNAVVEELTKYYLASEIEGLDDDMLLSYGMQHAMPDWSPNALEWIAREWAHMHEPENGVDCVAGTIIGWQFGYRCEQEDVPTIILMWCKEHNTENADAIQTVIDDRLNELVVRASADIDDDYTENDIGYMLTSYELPDYEYTVVLDRLTSNKKNVSSKLVDKLISVIFENLLCYDVWDRCEFNERYSDKVWYDEDKEDELYQEFIELGDKFNNHDMSDSEMIYFLDKYCI